MVVFILGLKWTIWIYLLDLLASLCLLRIVWQIWRGCWHPYMLETLSRGRYVCVSTLILLRTKYFQCQFKFKILYWSRYFNLCVNGEHFWWFYNHWLGIITISSLLNATLFKLVTNQRTASAGSELNFHKRCCEENCYQNPYENKEKVQNVY